MREKLSENFYADEFWCKHCRKIRFHPGFVDKLQAVRTELAMPMHPTSGCRCALYNKEIGGHASSLHILDVPQHPGQQGTLAVDIAAMHGPFRGRLFVIAYRHGFSIGWNAKRGFLHLDWRAAVGLMQTTFDY